MPQIVIGSESTIPRMRQTGDAFQEMNNLDSISRWLDEIGGAGTDVSAAQTKLDPLSLEKANQGARVSAARSRTASLLDIWASAQAHEV